MCFEHCDIPTGAWCLQRHFNDFNGQYIGLVCAELASISAEEKVPASRHLIAEDEEIVFGDHAMFVPLKLCYLFASMDQRVRSHHPGQWP